MEKKKIWGKVFPFLYSFSIWKAIESRIDLNAIEIWETQPCFLPYHKTRGANIPLFIHIRYIQIIFYEFINLYCSHVILFVGRFSLFLFFSSAASYFFSFRKALSTYISFRIFPICTDASC